MNSAKQKQPHSEGHIQDDSMQVTFWKRQASKEDRFVVARNKGLGGQGVEYKKHEWILG